MDGLLADITEAIERPEKWPEVARTAGYIASDVEDCDFGAWKQSIGKAGWIVATAPAGTRCRGSAPRILERLR